ncbi:hypothetical protein RhiirA1_509143 [Rhizophagus irregularis]|uniref:C2H2-type domain-containing protein n=1 Tax=Rhizophagus irregularis TaxID=588596 RepID=A0A2N0QRV8_9GLOM|nr:hypothetical protein RhiirA1_509143 [Rhizophagus irregularis]
MWTCNICFKTFNRSTSYYNHRRSHKFNYEISSSEHESSSDEESSKEISSDQLFSKSDDVYNRNDGDDGIEEIVSNAEIAEELVFDYNEIWINQEDGQKCSYSEMFNCNWWKQAVNHAPYSSIQLKVGNSYVWCMMIVKLMKSWAKDLVLIGSYSNNQCQYPKLHHFLYHLIPAIKDYCSPNGWNAETFEFLYKAYIKDPYHISNKRNVNPQILGTVNINLQKKYNFI